MRCKTFHILLLLKTAMFIGLSAVFYIFYFTTVVQKYAEGKEYKERRHGEPFLFLFLSKMDLLGS